MTVLRVVLPWAKTSELSANARLHWRKKHAKVKAQKRAADALAREARWHLARIPDGTDLRVTLTACPAPSTPWPDDDNLIAAQKGALDALAAVLRVDDTRFRVQPVVRGERCKAGAVIVTVEVQE